MPTTTARHTSRPRGSALLRVAAAGALAVGLLSGCTATGGGNPVRSAASAQTALDKGQTDKAVGLAEAAVLADPRNAEYRALLGQAYFSAGRFQSATQSFDDALELGHQSPRTALGLALAEAARGNQREAVQLLDDWQDVIPASDLGLALALAGDPGRGAGVLIQALRGGENTPTVRQNLALAYALGGRWSEARIMAAQDVPADQLDERLAQWGQLADPQATQQRVATLIGAPVRGDSGQPAALALSNYPDVNMLGAEALASANSAEEPVAPPVAVAALGELPALEADQPAPAPTFAAATPGSNAAPVAIAASAISTPVSSPAPEEAATAQSRRSTAYRVVGDYVPDRPIAARQDEQQPVARAIPTAKPRFTADAGRAPARSGTHAIQLGAFSSAANARHAVRVYSGRYSALDGYRLITTEATVNGKRYWRVAAAGIDGIAAARSLCRTVKGRGGACMVMRTPVEAPNSATRMAVARRR